MSLSSRLTQFSIRSLQQTHLSKSWVRKLSTVPTKQPPALTQHNSERRNPKLLLYASSAAAVVALAVLPHSPLNSTSVAMAEFSTVRAQTAATEFSKASLQTSKPHPGSPDIVLYQFKVCPFCNKVRAYLDYHGIPYRVVEVDPLRKSELKKFSADYRKVPIALIDEKQVNGSAAVIEAVRLATGADTGDKINAISSVEEQWLQWLDNHLIHLIAPNIYRTPGESLQTFNYITDYSKFSWWDRATIRYTGAAAMYMIGKRLKKKYNIDDERSAMHEAIEQWMAAIRNGGSNFLDGRNEPGVVDLSVYGVLKAIQTFDTFADLRAQNEEFSRWFDQMQNIVGDSSEISRE